MYMLQLTAALFLRTSKETEISLIWSTAAMPEKKPLQKLALLVLIFESKIVIFVKLQEVDEFCRGLHY